MKKVLLGSAVFLFLPFSSSWADVGEPASSSFLGIMLSLVAGVLGGVALAFAVKLHRLTKGGELSAAWQWVSSALFFFSAGQVLSFLAGAGWAPASPGTVALLQFGAGLGIVLGIARIKKVMS
jgi:hypothetical protein